MIRPAPTHSHRRALLEMWQQCGVDTVLALVVGSMGSSYRKPGAMALFDVDGPLVGALSGGCLDAEIAEHARLCLRDKRPLRLLLDTTDDDDLLFGSQSGCRGQIEILLWPNSRRQAHPLLEALRRADEEHRYLNLSVQLEGPGLGAGQASDGQRTLSWEGAGVAPFDANSRAGRLRLPPSPQLLLLGGGPEAPPLLEIAATAGWSVTVAEHRGRFLGDRLRRATQVLQTRPAQALTQLDLQFYDAVLCMTHLYAEDLAALRQLALSPLPWIGLLGPRLRRNALLRELGPLADALHDRLQAPVGLDLGGDGPEALALSIGAALQQVFNQRVL